MSDPAKIRALNDLLRQTFSGGRVVMTAAVAAMAPNQTARVLSAVRSFAAFNEDNDPHGEHDMAFLEVDGERYFFKIDYYDAALNTARKTRPIHGKQRAC